MTPLHGAEHDAQSSEGRYYLLDIRGRARRAPQKQNEVTLVPGESLQPGSVARWQAGPDHHSRSRHETRDLWILDLARGANSRVTFDPGEDHNPVL